MAERVLGGRSVGEVGGILSDEELLLNGLPAVKDRFLAPIEGGQDKVGLVGVTVKVERGASIIDEEEAVLAYLYCETPLSLNKYSDALEQILGSLRPAR